MAGPWDDYGDAETEQPQTQEQGPWDQFQQPQPEQEQPEQGAPTGEAGPWDSFQPNNSTRESSPQPDSSTAGAAARGFVNEGIPGLAGALAGAGPGAVVGSAIAPGIGTAIGGIVGALGGSMLSASVKHMILDRMGLADNGGWFSDQQAAADEAQHPYARAGGELGAAVVGFSPTRAAGPLARIGAAGVMGGMDAGQQLLSGEQFDPIKTAMAAATGAIAPTPRSGTEKYMGAFERMVPQSVRSRAEANVAAAQAKAAERGGIAGQPVVPPADNVEAAAAEGVEGSPQAQADAATVDRANDVTTVARGTAAENQPPPSASVGNEINPPEGSARTYVKDNAAPSEQSSSITQGEQDPGVISALKGQLGEAAEAPAAPQPEAPAAPPQEAAPEAPQPPAQDHTTAPAQPRYSNQAVEGTTINRTIPVAEGARKVGNEIYIDKNTPKTINMDGKALDPALPLSIRAKSMEEAVAAQKSVGRPDPALAKEVADFHMDEWLRQHGFDAERFHEMLERPTQEGRGSKLIGGYPEDVTATVKPGEDAFAQAPATPDLSEFKEVGNAPGQRPAAVGGAKPKVIDTARKLLADNNMAERAKALDAIQNPYAKAQMATKIVAAFQSKTGAAQPAEYARTRVSQAPKAATGVVVRSKAHAQRIERSLAAADAAFKKFTPERDYDVRKPEDLTANKERLKKIVEFARSQNGGELPHRSYNMTAARGEGAQKPPAGWSFVRAADRLLRNAYEKNPETGKARPYPEKVSEFLAKERLFRSGRPEDVDTATLNDRIDLGMLKNRRGGDEAVASAEADSAKGFRGEEFERVPAEDVAGEPKAIKTSEDLAKFTEDPAAKPSGDAIDFDKISDEDLEKLASARVEKPLKEVQATEAELRARKMQAQRAAREAAGKKLEPARPSGSFEDEEKIAAPRSVDRYLREGDKGMASIRPDLNTKEFPSAEVGTRGQERERIALMKQIRSSFERMLGDGKVKVKFPDDIRLDDDPAVGWDKPVTHAAGLYDFEKNVAHIALNLHDIVQGRTKLGLTAMHEAWHAMEDHLFNNREMRLLKDYEPQMRRDIVDYVRKSYGEDQVAGLKDLAPYEVRAIAFEKFVYDRGMKMKGNVQPPSGVRMVFDKVARFFEKVQNLLKGHGYTSLEDFQNSAFKGEFADRESRKLSSGSRLQGMLDEEEARAATRAASPRSEDEGRLPGFSEVPRSAWKTMFASDSPGSASLIRRILSPTTVSAISEHVAAVVRKFNGLAAADKAYHTAEIEKSRRIMDMAPVKDQQDFQIAMDTKNGRATLDPKYHPLFDAIKPVYEEIKGELEKLPMMLKVKFMEDYFPHMWKTPHQGEARALAQNWFMKQGNTSSLHERSIASIPDGIAMGFKLAYDNPIEATMRYMNSMHNYIQSVKMLQAGKEAGYVKSFDLKTVGGASGNSQSAIPPGWREIKGRQLVAGETLYGHEDWAEVYNNFMDPGIRQNETRAKLYDMIQRTSNFVTAVELGLSAFHAFTVGKESMISELGLAMSQAVGGHFKDAAVSAGKAVGAPVNAAFKGANVRDMQLKLRGGDTSIPADVAKTLNSLVEAGMRFHGASHDTTYEYSQRGSYGDPLKAMGNIFKAYRDGSLSNEWQYMKGVAKNEAGAAIGNIRDAEGGVNKAKIAAGETARFIGRSMQTVAQPLFERYIPNLKASAAYDAMHEYIKRNPQSSHEETMAAARRIVDSIDNRFGEMVHDNIFINKTAKQLGQVLMRSWSWNLGTVREIGGGIISAMNDPSRLSINNPAYDPRLAYVAAMPVVVGLASMTYQFLKTGKGPGDALDLMVPKTGGWSTRNGAPERAIMPGYEKDLFGWTHDPIGEAGNKLATAPKMVWETLMNKDYKGQQLRNPNDLYGKQMMDYLKYVGSNLGPISIRQLGDREQGTNIGGLERAASIRPAPGYMTNPARTQYLDQRHNQNEAKRKMRTEGKTQQLRQP